MTSLRGLAAQIAEERDVPLADMLEIVNTYAGQISDDEDLYDADAEELTDAGVEVIVSQIASDAFTGQPDLLDEVSAAQADVDGQDERLARRDSAIRKALAGGVPVRELVDATGLHRQRIYQIRDGKR